jgi:hypothetical protein
MWRVWWPFARADTPVRRVTAGRSPLRLTAGVLPLCGTSGPAAG